MAASMAADTEFEPDLIKDFVYVHQQLLPQSHVRQDSSWSWENCNAISRISASIPAITAI